MYKLDMKCWNNILPSVDYEALVEQMWLPGQGTGDLNLGTWGQGSGGLGLSKCFCTNDFLQMWLTGQGTDYKEPIFQEII